jgi:hypothetical protein
MAARGGKESRNGSAQDCLSRLRKKSGWISHSGWQMGCWVSNRNEVQPSFQTDLPVDYCFGAAGTGGGAAASLAVTALAVAVVFAGFFACVPSRSFFS